MYRAEREIQISALNSCRRIVSGRAAADVIDIIIIIEEKMKLL